MPPGAAATATPHTVRLPQHKLMCFNSGGAPIAMGCIQDTSGSTHATRSVLPNHTHMHPAHYQARLHPAGGADIFMVRIWNTSGDVSQGQGLFATDLVRAYAACEARLDAQQRANPGQVCTAGGGGVGPEGGLCL